MGAQISTCGGIWDADYDMSYDGFKMSLKYLPHLGII